MSNDLDYRDIMPSAEGRSWTTYLPVARELRDSGLSCLGAGEQAGRLPVVGRRALSSHGIVFISAGSGHLADPSGRRTVTAPAWFWLFPGVWHEYGPDRDGWSEHWALFTGVGTRGYESYGAWSRSDSLHAGGPTSEELSACFAGLKIATGTPGRRGQLASAALVHRLIGAAAAASDVDHRGQRTAAQLIIETATERLSVAERAVQAGVTPARLRAQVREETGLTPHELVLTVRLSRSQNLLALTDLTVAEISAQVGYDDPAYFSRLFTQRVGGLSPVQFRRQQQRGSRVSGAALRHRSTRRAEL